jgi:hypothetical protein
LGEKDQGEKMTAKDHRKRSWEKREVNQDIHRVAHQVAHQKAVYQVAHREAVHRVAHREAVYRDVYQEVNWKVTDAMFRTTSLRSIYKSMPIADDYRYV